MEVTKIDIKKTLLDLPYGTSIYCEAVRDRLEAIYKSGERPPEDAITFKERTYEIKKLVAPRSLKVDYLAVEMGENGVFDKLIAITDEQIETIKSEAYEAGFADANYRWHAKTWWQRVKFVFNR